MGPGGSRRRPTVSKAGAERSETKERGGQGTAIGQKPKERNIKRIKNRFEETIHLDIFWVSPIV